MNLIEGKVLSVHLCDLCKIFLPLGKVPTGVTVDNGQPCEIHEP
jgi:hypothetical protein